MSKSNHTPGPWAFSTDPKGWSYYIHQADDAAYTPNYSDVATVWKSGLISTCEGEDKSIQESNAQLIAAAPELLEALMQLTEACEKEFAGPLMIEFGDDESVGGGVYGDMSITFGMIRRANAAIAKAKGVES